METADQRPWDSARAMFVALGEYYADAPGRVADTGAMRDIEGRSPYERRCKHHDGKARQ